MAVKWSILIATLARRCERLTEGVLADLAPQLEQVEAGQIEIVALRNHGEKGLGDIRQRLVEEARGQYLCFVDDDDRLPDYYVSEVLPLLDGVDYIGWRMQAYLYGISLKPTYHTLDVDHWYETDIAYWRDVSHLNPIRSALAKQCDFRRTSPPEDVAWTDQARPLVMTQHYINRIMYHYYATEDSSWRGGEHWDGQSDHIDWTTPCEVPGFRWHPDST